MTGKEINKGSCIAGSEDFGMPVAEYGTKDFFDWVTRPLQG
jgi:hypothetical protein